MIEIPRRVSLLSQTVAALRKGIGERLWTGCLPGERRLCDSFAISRPTLRRALKMLAKEGLIAVQHGKRSRILRKESGSRPAKGSRLIGLVAAEPVTHLAHPAYQGLVEMRRHLAQSGFANEVLVCHSRRGSGQIRAAQHFLRHNAVFCCLLISVSHELQQWFAKKGVPALVLGSCREPLTLPSLDVDYRAVCRHAVGHLIAKGHRQIALVVPASGAAGDLASEEGFEEGIAASAQAHCRGHVVRHNGTARGITTKLDALFNSAQPPSVLLVAKALHVLIVIIYLLKRGLAVPDTVSLVARDHDYSFGIVNPPITHYAYDDQTYAQQLSRLMLQLAEVGRLPLRPNYLFPRLVKGGTVKELRTT